jgi:hypothetical protein
MNTIHHPATPIRPNNTSKAIRRLLGATVLLTLAALTTAGAASASPAAPRAHATGGTSPATAVTGGITLYQVKLVNQSITLGPQASPTTVTTKAVPAGKYLVTGFIGVNAQPGSFIVCAVSNTLNGNDGVFGTYANQTGLGAEVNVSETEVVNIGTGQSIHLTCDDNNAKPGDVLGEAVIEAIPVNALH